MSINLEGILVSVIIPVYNSEKWIGKTLDSVLNQSYKNIEIIVVNDGSTDNTAKILTKYSRYENIKIYDIENSGPSVARNYGVKKSTGELIAFLDADDTWDFNKIKKQVKYFCKHHCNLLLTNINIINEQDEIIERKQKKLPKSKERQTINFFQGKVINNTPTIMVKRKVFEDVGGFNVDLIHREDHFFLMKVANKYGIHLLNEYLVNRRKWAESMSTDIFRVKGDQKTIEEFYYKTRYRFYEESIKAFPFLNKYLNVELGKFHNALGSILYRAGFIKNAKIQIKKAINYNFKVKYLLKYILLSFPDILRKAILK